MAVLFGVPLWVIYLGFSLFTYENFRAGGLKVPTTQTLCNLVTLEDSVELQVRILVIVVR